MASKKRAKLRDPSGIDDLKQLRLVEVTWHDAASNSSWAEFRDIRKQRKDGLVECQTAGYLVKLGKSAVILAQTRAEDGKLASEWSIPRKWVKSIKVVR